MRYFIIAIVFLSITPFAKAHEGEKPDFCTMEYKPVCAEVKVKCIKAPCESVKQTISNACVARSRGAKILYKGVCESEKKEEKHDDKKVEKEPPKFPFGSGPTKGNVVPGKNAPVPMDEIGEFDLSADSVTLTPQGGNDGIEDEMREYEEGITVNLSDGQTINEKEFKLKGKIDKTKWRIKGRYPGYVTIFDIDGKTMLKFKLRFAKNKYKKEVESKLELKDIPSGAYVIRIENFNSRKSSGDYRYVNIKVNIVSKPDELPDDMSEGDLDKIHDLLKKKKKEFKIEKVEHEDDDKIKVKTVRFVRLFGLFKIKLQETYILSKDLTQIIRHIKPWWSKLTI